MPGLIRAPAGMIKGGRSLGGLCIAGGTVWQRPVASLLPANALIYDMTQGNGDIVSRSGATPFVRGRGMSWRADPVGVAGTSNTTSFAVATIDTSMIQNSLLFSMVMRFNVSDYTKVLLASDQGTRLFIFSTFNGMLRIATFVNGVQTVVATASKAVTNGPWYVLTGFIDDTTRSAQVRMNGIELGSGKFTDRNRAVDPASPYLVLRGRAFNAANNVAVDGSNGDTIAFGYIPNATADMIGPLEAEMRAIAAAKGIMPQ